MEDKKYTETTEQQFPDKLSPKHYSLMRKLIAGKSLQVAAQELGYSYERASIIKMSPLFKEEMEKLQADVKEKFSEAEGKSEVFDKTRKQLHGSSLKAAKALEAALDDENVHGRIRAASDILDRTGYGKEDKLKADVLVEPSQGLINMLNRVMGKDKKDGPESEGGEVRGSQEPDAE